MFYFIYGDIPLEGYYDSILEKIYKDNDSIPFKSFDCGSGEGDLFLDEVSINSIFQTKSIVVLKRLNLLKKDGVNILKGLSKLSPLNKYIIITFEEKLDEYKRSISPITKTLLKNVPDYFEVTCVREGKGDSYVVDYLCKSLNISKGEGNNLINIIGSDYTKVKNEVTKIKVFLDGRPYSFSEVEGIISKSSDGILNTYIEEVLDGNIKGIINYLKVEGNYTYFVYAFSKELITLMKLKSFQNSGIINKGSSYNDFKDSYKNIKRYFTGISGRPIHEYPLFLKNKKIERFSYEFLERVFKRIVTIDYNIKSGRGEGFILVESFLGSFKK